jgi:hypothetical protein
MLVGAMAAGTYGVPRSTRDVDVLMSIEFPAHVTSLIQRLSLFVAFDPQVTFDTLTWGRPLLRAWCCRRRALRLPDVEDLAGLEAAAGARDGVEDAGELALHVVVAAVARLGGDGDQRVFQDRRPLASRSPRPSSR